MLATTQGIQAPRNAFSLGFTRVLCSLPESALVFAAALILLACLPQALGKGNATSQGHGTLHLDVQLSSHSPVPATVEGLAGLLKTPSPVSLLSDTYFATSKPAEPFPFQINIHFQN